MFAKKLIVSALVVLASGMAVAAASAVDKPQAIVKIGNIVVNEQDVQRELQRRLPLQVSFHGSIKPERLEQMRTEALEAVTERTYKVQYALDNEIALDAAGFEKEWADFQEKNKGLKDLPSEAKGVYRSDFYFERLAKKAEEIAVDKKVTVTDAEVKKYYEENKKNYYVQKLYKASHVFVKVMPEETAEEKAAKLARAEKLYERAKAGEDFYNLAYYESDDRSKYVGGSLGSFHAGQTVQEFDEALQKMKVGEISKPVRTMYGYHIIRLDEVTEPRQLSFDEAAVKIRTNFTEERRKQLYEEWMKQLRQKYPAQAVAK